MTSDLAISIIIPSYQGAQRLGLILEALLPQTRPEDEILIIDDCSTDETAEVARGFGATVYSMTVNSGVGRCRNEGIRRARHEVLALFDDDVVPFDDYLDHVRRLFSDPAMMICQGPNTPDPPIPDPNIWKKAEAVMWHYCQTEKWLRAGRCYCVYTHSFCVRRSFIMEVGLFREDFPGAGCEEFEFTERMLLHTSIPFTPELNSHHVPKSLWPRLKVLYARARGYTTAFTGHTHQDRLIRTDKIRLITCWLMLVVLAAGVFDSRIVIALVPLALLFAGLNASLYRYLVRSRRSELIPVLTMMRLLQYWSIGSGVIHGMTQKVGKAVMRAVKSPAKDSRKTDSVVRHVRKD